MTCGLAVKRPHDYEAFLDSGVEVKRTRTSAHCSPFRPQLGTLAASLPQSSSPTTPRGYHNPDDDSPFASVSGKCQLSSNQLESYLRAEIRYLKRRKLIPRRNPDADGSGGGGAGSSNVYRRGASSPSSCHSGSDSDGEASSGRKEATPSASDLGSLYDKPQFSLKQVKLICERLLKEQEVRLRYEYETLLNKKLEEKHEEYVQFAKEQLEHRSAPADLSYLS
ncbi:Protein E01A2.6 [Aphelenchoides avenae]|nr:Protein E01A2.6 [Aphelenchus avenae]